MAEQLDRIEAAVGNLIAATRPEVPHCSVELSQSAKGTTQVTVKVYAVADELEAAAGRASTLYDELRRMYAER